MARRTPDRKTADRQIAGQALPFGLRLRLAATRAGLVLESLTRAFWPAVALLLLALALALLGLP